VWTPLPLRSVETQVRRFHSLRLIGRLRDGAALPSAQAELDAAVTRAIAR
jgi:hypothetical protein